MPMIDVYTDSTLFARNRMAMFAESKTETAVAGL